MTAKLTAPQLVLHSRMLYFNWVAADPAAAQALMPSALQPARNDAIFMNQYAVDSEDQTSGFGAYSLTYLGLDLDGLDAPDEVTPGRYWTHYFNSSPAVRTYARDRGVPASEGTTTLELDGERLVVTTHADGVPIIRTVAHVGSTIAAVARGQLRYITSTGGKFVSGLYPYVAETVTPWRIESLEFLDPTHSVYALRPAQPLQVEGGFYAPRSSFCYPGGEEVLDI